MSIFPGSIVPAGTQSQQALVMARQTEFVICNQSIYTVCQGGKSWGSIRQGIPPRNT
jgi:hypothetical protein